MEQNKSTEDEQQMAENQATDQVLDDLLELGIS